MRIDEQHLHAILKRLNEITDSPTSYFCKETKEINIGHYTLSGAYGGWQLQRIMNSSGGVDLPLGETGHIPKAKLYDMISSFIRGYHLAKGIK